MEFGRCTATRCAEGLGRIGVLREGKEPSQSGTSDRERIGRRGSQRTMQVFGNCRGLGITVRLRCRVSLSNAPYAAVDGNIKRVFARLFLMDAPINDAKSAKLFQQQADALLDPNEPGFFNQAMMELGAVLCRPQSPACLVCPVNGFCEAFEATRQADVSEAT